MERDCLESVFMCIHNSTTWSIARLMGHILICLFFSFVCFFGYQVDMCMDISVERTSVAEV